VHTVEAVIRYAGLEDRIEPVATKPFDPATPLAAINPLGKVPTLVLDDGEYLAGGPVIYEYLDTLHKRRKLYPAKGRARFTTLRQVWMADGLFDTFVLLIIESWLPPAQQRSDYIARCWSKVTAILDQMERDAPGYGRLDIAQVRGIGAVQFLRQTEAGAARVQEDHLAGADHPGSRGRNRTLRPIVRLPARMPPWIHALDVDVDCTAADAPDDPPPAPAESKPAVQDPNPQE
jgi:glutathione S-transferase